MTTSSDSPTTLAAVSILGSRGDQRTAHRRSGRPRLRRRKRRRPMLSPCRTFEHKRIRRSIAGSFASVRYGTALPRSRLVQRWSGKCTPAGLKGEPLAGVQSEIREEWLETLDRAIGALGTVVVGLTQAMKTLKALQSETSDFPVNLPVPDLGQPVLNLATEHEAPAPSDL